VGSVNACGACLFAYTARPGAVYRQMPGDVAWLDPHSVSRFTAAADEALEAAARGEIP
jgi:hypothetical protein